MGYLLSKKAKKDIADIYDYSLTNYGQAQADNYLNTMNAMLKFLAESPKIARLREEFDPPVYIYPSQSHMIIYKLTKDGNIYISRIVHASSDWLSNS